MISSSSGGRPLVLLVDGILDVPAAQALATRIAEAEAGAELAIDLTRVREFHDFGVSLLALAVSRSRSRVSIHGLRHHHEQLLRYLGVASALGPRRAVDVS